MQQPVGLSIDDVRGVEEFNPDDPSDVSKLFQEMVSSTKGEMVPVDVPLGYVQAPTGKLVPESPDFRPDPGILAPYDTLFRCQFRHLMSFSINACDNPRNTSHSMAMKFRCDDVPGCILGCAHPATILECDRRRRHSEQELDAYIKAQEGGLK